MAAPETFQTARLDARRLSGDDFAELCIMHKDACVMAALGGVRSDEVTKEYAQANELHWCQYGFGTWALRSKDGDFAGRTALRYIALTLVDHIASRRVMEKLDFQFEADREIKGELCAVYRLFREQGVDT